ncbi:hypothetical protein MTZ49_07170 [Entomomonas sp. E2T0]|uniref:hypothetical protein n=1 Tax=Entomomonas sp. E2T0 TaxID=2930213 RepID=UPI0022283034|nr:hypothetical protein [Entomomonas sp. E2T0]UYZ85319.1 hypothetical protein MTZ49_07170 [Entomomonas sp. E2T0]
MSNCASKTADSYFKRMMTDDAYYFANNLKIIDKDGEIVPFYMNEAQKIVHDAVEKQLQENGKVRAICVKGRQQGISTYVGARFYKRTSSKTNKKTFILTHDLDATDNLFNMAKNYYDLSHDEFKPKINARNAKTLSFSKLNSSYRVATAKNKTTGRSFTAQFFHGSEVAYWPFGINIMAGLGQSIPDKEGTEIFLESTANGMNFFHERWKLAVAGKSDYIPIFVPWYIQEEYRREPTKDLELNEYDLEYMETYGLDINQMAWRANKIFSDFNGSKDVFNQEYPATCDLAFQKVGHQPLVSTFAVTKARKQVAAYMQRIGAHVVGVDVARYGDDDTSIYHRQGRVAWKEGSYNGLSVPEVASICANLLRNDPSIRMMFIDITGGLGAGVYDLLVLWGHGKRVTPVVFNAKPSDPRKYYNKRAEIWGEMADWIADPITPSIPDTDRLHMDLTAPSYSFTHNGQIKLDSKEKIKKETGKSPDDGDALALTFAAPIQADDSYTPDWQKNLTNSDLDYMAA